MARSAELRSQQVDWGPTDDHRAVERAELGVIEGGPNWAAGLVRLLATTVLVGAVFALLGALILHATIVESQSELDQLYADIAQVELSTEIMRHELAQLEAPSRVLTVATQLGMVEAPMLQFLEPRPVPLGAVEMSAVVRQLQLPSQR